MITKEVLSKVREVTNGDRSRLRALEETIKT